MKCRTALRLISGLFLCLPAWAQAGEAQAAIAELKVSVDTVWVLVAAFLVFWMNAGFGCVEAGFCRAKNAVNIVGKNFVVFGLPLSRFG
jgi:Amt family ammonium transporter